MESACQFYFAKVSKDTTNTENISDLNLQLVNSLFKTKIIGNTIGNKYAPLLVIS